MNYSARLVESFIEECFNSAGKHKDTDYQPQPSEQCKWCPFNNRSDLCNKQSIL